MSNFKVKGLRLLLGSPEAEQPPETPGWGSAPAMPPFRAALQNTDVEKLQGHSALRGKVLTLVQSLLGSSSSRKFSLKNIFILPKGRSVLRDLWCLITWTLLLREGAELSAAACKHNINPLHGHRCEQVNQKQTGEAVPHPSKQQAPGDWEYKLHPPPCSAGTTVLVEHYPFCKLLICVVSLFEQFNTYTQCLSFMLKLTTVPAPAASRYEFGCSLQRARISLA